MPWRIRGALNARPAEGLFPVIILSHPSSGNRFTYSEIASQLASRGFIVGAPSHIHDNINNMDYLFTWKQLSERVNEINEALRLILEDPIFKNSADRQSIGLMGFGAGANAALLLGGCLPDCENWPQYCIDNSATDVYCAPMAKGKIKDLCMELPLKKSLANPDIKAIALISPGFGMLFSKNAFKYFYPPVLIIEAGKDHFNKPQNHSRVMGRNLGAKAFYLALPDADMGAFMDECPESIARELPELCFSITSGQRKKIQEELVSTLCSFFNRYLKEKKNMPVIPPPPELAETESKNAATTKDNATKNAQQNERGKIKNRRNR